LAPLLEAACIDLKGFDGKFYRDLMDAELEPVLNTSKT
jgi:pyruvate-formate lyase-activating enzyme